MDKWEGSKKNEKKNLLKAFKPKKKQSENPKI
jgi:hypothetical protein